MTHAQAFELLPWLVNGSLAGAEREALELHVRTCVPCRRELGEQGRLQAALQAHPAVHLSAQSNFERLALRLDEPASAPPRRARPLPQPLGAWLRFAVVGAAGLCALGVLWWLMPSNRDDGARYSTLATQRAASGAVEVDLVFAATADSAARAALLADVGGTIVAGPSAIGRYTVRLEGRAPGTPDTAALIERLAQDPRVRFAARRLSPEPAQ